MDNLKILYKYTTKSRRVNFLRGINSIVDNSDSKNFAFLISIENKIYDPNMHPFPEINHFDYQVAINKDKPTTKIGAINRDLSDYSKYKSWDILVNMSDDMFFTFKGFDNIIREEFIKENNLDLFLHFPDGNQRNLATMTIIGKTYFDRDGYIYHPDYKSLWADNEAQEVSQIRGCYRFVDQVIFNHLHPAYGKAVSDAQYTHTESYSHEDGQTYIRRKANGFN